MTDEPDSLVLQHLRAIRTDLVHSGGDRDSGWRGESDLPQRRGEFNLAGFGGVWTGVRANDFWQNRGNLRF
jgi:hypothetical protein